VLALALAIAVAVALAWWSWRERLNEPRARLAAGARAVGLAALLLLLLDPGIGVRAGGGRAIVLLDNSISMHAAGGQAAEAGKLAASLGDTVPFGEAAPGEPGGRTALSDALAGAVAAGRPVVVVTDGEIADSAAIPADLLAQATVRVLPRRTGADMALVDVRAPSRLAAGDSLTMDVDAWRTPDAPDTASVLVLDGNTPLLHGALRFAGARAQLHLTGALPHGMKGEHWLQVIRAGAADAEPGDDARWLKLNVTPAPGIVLLADTPDWDARFLYRTLVDVAESPVRGYAQLERGQWRRMDNLQRVTTADVTAAARAADVLAVRGNVDPWRSAAHARLLWPEGTLDGDWYVVPGGISPVTGAFAGVDADSLPPATSVRPISVDSSRDWIGATARRARRGAAIPVIAGHGDAATGRTATLAADGLYRWAFRGGASEQVWRTMISGVLSWLLATPDVEGARARPVAAVTGRGRAVRFRWTGDSTPQPLAVRIASIDGGPAGNPAHPVSRADTLRFDASGEASLVLPVGTYRYTLDGGVTGTLAVEPYADELVPAAITLHDHTATVAVARPRRSLRESVWLFAVVVAAFGAEWLLRRRLGLR
jgi:hypothetical protein